MTLAEQNQRQRVLMDRACNALQEFRVFRHLREELWRALQDPIPAGCCLCVYCGHTLDLETMTPEAAHAAMIAHDRQCDKNPLVLALRGVLAIHGPVATVSDSVKALNAARAALEGRQP